MNYPSIMDPNRYRHSCTNVGVDYANLLRRCLAKDKNAMSAMFRLGNTAHFDAASSQGHATALGVLLGKLGDDFFAKCLNAESEDTQSDVRDALLYDAGFDPPINPIPDL